MSGHNLTWPRIAAILATALESPSVASGEGSTPRTVWVSVWPNVSQALAWSPVRADESNCQRVPWDG